MNRFDFDTEIITSPPYECFVGNWDGVCRTFSPEGEFLEDTKVKIQVNWISANQWHFYEHISNLYQVGKVAYEFDVNVQGKYCYGSSPQIEIQGVQLTSTNYVFTMKSQVSQSTVYNNHYFITPDHRRIITHKLKDGVTYIFQIQDFVKVVV
ncbi:hypothetical protein A0J48_006880 [Sphaerospermopsis aphanizomenoides BCCUSP55]|uniref:hypothetical protein n=1 Tax=Sphaerospermopsis aphanizomenoides TaxID=459663 RepID=UPI00190681E8|nr:hypothetical protein [Sphaerospermopsis aphanizomenoides]MBK1987260.1 hypothetical protein [Sphaerospermopsis aphanizomenoides BCCUSP55]